MNLYRAFRVVTHLSYGVIGLVILLWVLITFGVYVIPFPISQYVWGIMNLTFLFGGIFGTVTAIVLTLIDTVIRISSKTVRMKYAPFVPWIMVLISTTLVTFQVVMFGFYRLTNYGLSGGVVEFWSTTTAITFFVIPIQVALWLGGVIAVYLSKRK